LRNAFNRFRIGYASIDDHNGISRFKNDPAIECFLLHARAHSSGLNLVNASHVFLCEPLLNTALELQAIARVDRIGQQHETTVWLYLVSGTVEESIHNLSVQRRMEHMGRNAKGKSKESTPELLDANIEAANTLEMEHAALTKLMSKDRNAGEAVAQGDLWQCLFGHMANKAAEPERDLRLQEQAVLSYLAGEAAEARRG
jgi:E3 ubiquitin-protein ligase SHPRH